MTHSGKRNRERRDGKASEEEKRRKKQVVDNFDATKRDEEKRTGGWRGRERWSKKKEGRIR